MYDDILMPTDGSEGAEVAFEHALDLARKYDAKIHLLYVADVRIESVSDFISNISGALEDVGREATEELASRADEEGVKARPEVVRGIPHIQINSYVEDEEIDLVVMGTHGRTGVDRMLLGSTTEKVVRTSDVPVMTVRRNDQ